MKVSFFIDRPVFSAVISIISGCECRNRFAGGCHTYRAGAQRYSWYAVYGIKQLEHWKFLGYGNF